MILLRAALWPLCPIYRIILILRNLFFEKRIFKIKKVEAKVISIGNITVGGSGKTPLTIYIANLLKQREIKPGILSRGYGRNSKGYLFVSDGKNILTEPGECGDEIYLSAVECKAPAAVCERRVEGAKRFLKDADIEAIVLDDGFQHRWIHRDLNLLIFDQNFLIKAGSIDHQLLPAGNMRESFSAMKRADAVIINRKFSDKTNIPISLLPYFENMKIFKTYYVATGIYDVKDFKYYPIDEFKGQKSLLVVGVANPFSFINVLSQNKIDASNKLIFRDHKKYSSREIQKIRKTFYSTNSHSVITTAKDAVKLTKYSNEFDDIDIYYLKIELAFDEKEEFDDFLINRIKS